MGAAWTLPNDEQGGLFGQGGVPNFCAEFGRAKASDQKYIVERSLSHWRVCQRFVIIDY